MGGDSTPIRALKAVASGGVSETYRTKPFQSGGSEGTKIGKLANAFLTGGTAGIVDFEKNRINVPFSGAQVRSGGRSTIDALSLGTARKEGNEFVDSGYSRQITPYVGMVGALATGAGAAGAAGVGTAAGGGMTTGGAIASTAAVSAAGTAAAAQQPKPKLPGMPEPAKIDQAAIDAANAVQTADSEARRRRASKRQSSVLSNFQGASQIGVSPATLQPAAPRRSVLG